MVRTQLIVICIAVSMLLLGCMTAPYKAASSPYYVFQTKELNFESGRYGIFCSNEYSIRVHLNTLSSGPFDSSYECESSETLANLRNQRKAEIETIFKDPKIKRYRKMIESGEVKIGMPRKAVILSLGEPSDINRTQTYNSESEQLVYPGKYIYIRNDRVEAIQD